MGGGGDLALPFFYIVFDGLKLNIIDKHLKISPAVFKRNYSKNISTINHLVVIAPARKIMFLIL